LEWCSNDPAERRVLLAREPGGPPPVPKAYQTALECAAHVYECGSAPLTLNSARLRHQRHLCCDEYVIDCTPPAASDEVVCCGDDGTWVEGAAGCAAAPAAASVEGRCFIKYKAGDGENKECPLAAYAAAAVAVTTPPGAPGNERVECDGGLHVRWEISSRTDDGRAGTVTLYPGCKALGGGAYDCARGCPYKSAADATRRDIRDYARVTDGDVRRCVAAYRTQERADLACPACAACGVRDPRLAYAERGPLSELPAGHWMRARADFAGRLSAVRFELVARQEGGGGFRDVEMSRLDYHHLARMRPAASGEEGAVELVCGTDAVRGAPAGDWFHVVASAVRTDGTHALCPACNTAHDEDCSAEQREASQPRAGAAVVYAGADGTWREGVLERWEAGADAVDAAVIAGVEGRVAPGAVCDRAFVADGEHTTHAAPRPVYFSPAQPEGPTINGRE